MSKATTRRTYIEASYIALDQVKRLRPYCERIEIAGSIRRGVQEIGDIEIVAIPKPNLDMFGEPSQDHQLDTLDWKTYGQFIKGGHKYKQIELTEGITLDLFIVTPPAQWGVIFLLRTGPEAYGHRFVTAKSQLVEGQRGLLPGYLRFQDGAIWSRDHIIETPEEIDVYNLVGLPYLEPRERK